MNKLQLPEPAASSPSTGNSQNTPSTYSAQSSGSFSTTNVQVAGVDEADTVKTDGQYIYTVPQPKTQATISAAILLQTSNAVYIVNADPQNPQVVSKIALGNDTEPAGLFLSPDGTKLVVLASKYQFYAYPLVSGAVPVPNSGSVAMPMIPAYQADVYTYINVYDVSNKANPVLTRNFTVSGSYFDSRMIGNYVYAVVSQPATDYNNTVTLPVIYNGNSAYDIAPTSVYYADMVAAQLLHLHQLLRHQHLRRHTAANQHDCYDGGSQHNVCFPKQHVRNLPNMDRRRAVHFDLPSRH